MQISNLNIGCQMAISGTDKLKKWKREKRFLVF